MHAPSGSAQDFRNAPTAETSFATLPVPAEFLVCSRVQMVSCGWCIFDIFCNNQTDQDEQAWVPTEHYKILQPARTSGWVPEVQDLTGPLRADLNARADGSGPDCISGEHAGAKPKGAVICEGPRLIIGGEGRNSHHRPKDLFAAGHATAHLHEAM